MHPMLKYAFLAIMAAVAVAVALVLLPTMPAGPRPEPKILASGDPVPATNFTVHDAAPPTATVPAAPPASVTDTPPAPGATPPGGDLDAAIQRLRNAAAKPADTPPPDPDPSVPALPAVITPTPVPDAVPPPRFPSATSQGTRWRMVRSGNGFNVSIDLGNGRVADVHVLPAFANLDPASVNVRIDYLRETILQTFGGQPGSYTFARDGSVSLDR